LPPCALLPSQRAWAELDGFGAIDRDLLHDRVAVPVRIDEREQNVELDRRYAGYSE
jgi:hypothetical protein